MNIISIFILLLLFFSDITLYSQELDPSKITLERIYENHDFAADTAQAVTWLTGGNEYLSLIKRSNTQRVVKYNLLTKDSIVLISDDQLISPFDSNKIKIYSYAISSDNKFLLIRLLRNYYLIYIRLIFLGKNLHSDYN